MSGDKGDLYIFTFMWFRENVEGNRRTEYLMLRCCFFKISILPYEFIEPFSTSDRCSAALHTVR